MVCVATLNGAPVWCERGPAELHCPVDVVTDGSRDGDRVGWLAVAVSPKGVVAEAWFVCARVGALLWVAECCGKAMALWLLRELGVHVGSVRSFVADNTGATYGEDGGCASDGSWDGTLRLRSAAAVLQSGAAEIYVLAQHNLGSQSPVALVQARSDARAKQGTQAAGNGCIPFREWLGSHFCLVWRGILAADPSAVLEACYSEAHIFISNMPAGLSTVWVRFAESGHV